MKKTKKLASLLLALVMVLSMSASVFAEGEEPAAEEKGSITVNGYGGEVYSIYRILDLDSYHKEEVNNPSGEGTVDVGQYSYKVNEKWSAFFDTEDAQKLFAKDTNGFVTRKDNTPDLPNNVATFAEAALEWAKTNKVEPDETRDMTASEAGVSCEVKFTDLKLGYYLLDTTLGSLCTLNTTNPDIVINDKNKVPTNTKQVAEGPDWGAQNDAKVGDTVLFRSTLEVKKGVQNLVYHDTMDTTLSFNPDSVSIVLDPDTTIVKDKNMPLQKDTDYTVEISPADKCTFHVVFTENFLKTLDTGEHKIVISYNAQLTEGAINVDKSENKSHVSYGEKNTVTKDSITVTKTWELPVFKYATKNGVQNGLSETEFTLALDADQSNVINLIMVDSGVAADPNGTDTRAVYRVATPEEVAKGKGLTTTIVTNESGKFVIKGLDSGTYFLKETKAKKGYNAPSEAFRVWIDPEGKIHKNNATATVIEYGIENNAGTLLPTTGGIGTTIFYVVGSILLVGAAVLLIAKKRMSAVK